MIPFFGYPPTIRKVIYTTNAIESINASLRKVTKKRGAFPNPESVRKVMYLAIMKASERWSPSDPRLGGGAQPLHDPVRRTSDGPMKRPVTQKNGQSPRSRTQEQIQRSSCRDRESNADIPVDETPVEMNGEQESWQRSQRSLLSVVHGEGTEENRSPEILYGWFGPDAGRQGRIIKSNSRGAEDGWRAAPKSGALSQRRALQVGGSHRREDVAAARGDASRTQTWQAESSRGVPDPPACNPE